jgi:hypothetical protein
MSSLSQNTIALPVAVTCGTRSNLAIESDSDDDDLDETDNIYI